MSAEKSRDSRANSKRSDSFDSPKKERTLRTVSERHKEVQKEFSTHFREKMEEYERRNFIDTRPQFTDKKYSRNGFTRRKPAKERLGKPDKNPKKYYKHSSGNLFIKNIFLYWMVK